MRYEMNVMDDKHHSGC